MRRAANDDDAPRQTTGGRDGHVTLPTPPPNEEPPTHTNHLQPLAS